MSGCTWAVKVRGKGKRCGERTVSRLVATKFTRGDVLGSLCAFHSGLAKSQITNGELLDCKVRNLRGED